MDMSVSSLIKGANLDKGILDEIPYISSVKYHENVNLDVARIVIPKSKEVEVPYRFRAYLDYLESIKIDLVNARVTHIVVYVTIYTGKTNVNWEIDNDEIKLLKDLNASLAITYTQSQ